MISALLRHSARFTKGQFRANTKDRRMALLRTFLWQNAQGGVLQQSGREILSKDQMLNLVLGWGSSLFFQQSPSARNFGVRFLPCGITSFDNF